MAKTTSLLVMARCVCTAGGQLSIVFYIESNWYAFLREENFLYRAPFLLTGFVVVPPLFLFSFFSPRSLLPLLESNLFFNFYSGDLLLDMLLLICGVSKGISLSLSSDVIPTCCDYFDGLLPSAEDSLSSFCVPLVSTSPFTSSLSFTTEAVSNIFCFIFLTGID